ncbi:GGDEF domain-containing protein [Cryptosporangium phraense]|uniref:GGDEF domain-containing protein n=1 Tax=Cryptosporangium phraense TaxID=2593070 RepID=A0A545AH43_9ACTN|nr:GGDEF domain-containing protein [Cryptosporangium phraense]TQS40631.1 GGDEF domain-containing protein [Cryptosporangium phraense]
MRRVPAWLAPAVAVACGLPAAFRPGSAFGHISYLVGFSLVVGLGWARLRTIPGPARTGYGLIVGALTIWLVGDLLYDLLTLLLGPRGDVSPSDALWIGGYPLLAVGLIHLVRLRTSGRLREAILDALAMSTVMAWLCWQFLILPAAVDQRLTLASLFGAIYPLGDVVLFAVVLILVMAPGPKSGPTVYLVGALTVTLVGDVLISMLPVVFEGLSRAVQADRLDGVLLVANSLFVGAVLHPGAAGLAEARAPSAQRLHPARVLFLGIALAAMPLFDGFNSFTTTISRISLCVSIVMLTSLVLVRFLFVVREQEASRAALAHQAHHDQLTGLANRQSLRTVLDLALTGPSRAYGPVLFYLDLNGFKQINDRYGHAAGDAVLMEMASRLQSELRVGDVAARLGGDEFVVLVECLETQAEAEALGLRLKNLGADPVPWKGELLTVGASVGVSTAGDFEAPDVDSMLAAADADMYRHKSGVTMPVGVSSR